jgi:hypothetical protein
MCRRRTNSSNRCFIRGNSHQIGDRGIHIAIPVMHVLAHTTYTINHTDCFCTISLKKQADAFLSGTKTNKEDLCEIAPCDWAPRHAYYEAKLKSGHQNKSCHLGETLSTKFAYKNKFRQRVGNLSYSTGKKHNGGYFSLPQRDPATTWESATEWNGSQIRNKYRPTLHTQQQPLACTLLTVFTCDIRNLRAVAQYSELSQIQYMTRAFNVKTPISKFSCDPHTHN